MSIRRRIKVETRDRKDVLEEAIISQDDFLEKFFTRPKDFHWFFGAGVSNSAGVPLSQEIINEIIVKVFEKTNPAKRGQVAADDLREWVSREKWYNPNFAYISALEKEYPSVFLRTELFRRYMKGRFPSPAQLMYAIGVKENKLAPRCYTTNWDTLTEDAFYWLRGTNCVTIKGPDQLREVKDPDRRYVVKIHGDLDRYDVRYLREGMAKHHDDVRDFLINSLSGKSLVVLGYSGMEYSVMNMLMEIVHDHEEVLSGGLYWGYVGNTKHIPESVSDLMAVGLDKGKDFRIFEATEADFLFETIAQRLDFTSIEDELKVAFFRFNKMPYGGIRGRKEAIVPKLTDLAHRDLLDEGFLVRDYNAIIEVWQQDAKGMFKKQEEKDRVAEDARRKLINHCYNDLKHESFADAEVKLKDVRTKFPDDEMVHWGLAWAQYATGRYDEALENFAKSLEINPKNVKTYICQAMCYHFLDRSDDEMECYNKVLELDPNLDYIWFNRGLAAHKMGLKETEAESYESATKVNQSNVLAWYHLGLCYVEQGRNLMALHCLSRASEINPRMFESSYNSGVLMGRLGQDSQAIAYFDNCIHINEEDDEAFKARGIAEVMTSQYEHACESYEEYMQAHADDHEAWANYGLALHGCERHEEAMDLTERFLEQHPNDARAWYNKALILYATGDNEGAMAAYDKSLELDDDLDMVWYRKALLMGKMDQFKGQIEYLTRFLDRNEQDLHGWFELGEANRKLGEWYEDLAEKQRYYSAAVLAYDRALDVQRTDLKVWLQKAVCLNRLRRYDEAKECILYLERYDKENAEVWYQKGMAEDGLGQQLEAADTFAYALKLDPNHEDAYYRRGLLLAELEQFAKAVDHFENVIRLNENRWQAYHFKGVCVVNQKEYQKALQVFEEGFKEFPGQPRFLVDKALAHVMMRQIDEAKAMLTEAISIDESLRAEIEGTPEFAGLL